MKIIKSVKEMQSYSETLRLMGQRIAFVPTMGCFHDGHLSLMRDGKERGDCLVVSIYVNPIQFGPGEDFEKYPRVFEKDAMLAEPVGVDVIFNPSPSDMYPDNYQTFIQVEEVTQNLCGMTRPTHFRGVTTVCAKLFNIVKPHVTIFGRKDFQQLVAIKQMVNDLNMDLEVIGMPTMRESDGLAMSSRNIYLGHQERESALSLSRSLKLAQGMYIDGERRASVIIDKVTKFISGFPYTEIDYAAICDTKTLKNIDYIMDEAVLALAVKVKSTRLIDNHVFGEILNI